MPRFAVKLNFKLRLQKQLNIKEFMKNTEEQTLLRIAESNWGSQYEFLLTSFGNGKIYTAQPVIMNEEHPAVLSKPTFCLEKDGAQQIFNRLYQLGFRPTDGNGSPGHIESVKYHLEDMRALVFNSEAFNNFKDKK